MSFKIYPVGIAYEVVEASEEECPELEGRYGYTDLTRKIIVIRKTDPPAVKQDTLIHEAGHALFEESGLKALFDKDLKESVDRDKFEETFLALASPHIKQLVARSGKQIWRWGVK